MCNAPAGHGVLVGRQHQTDCLGSEMEAGHAHKRECDQRWSPAVCITGRAFSEQVSSPAAGVPDRRRSTWFSCPSCCTTQMPRLFLEGGMLTVPGALATACFAREPVCVVRQHCSTAWECGSQSNAGSGHFAWCACRQGLGRQQRARPGMRRNMAMTSPTIGVRRPVPWSTPHRLRYITLACSVPSSLKRRPCLTRPSLASSSG